MPNGVPFRIPPQPVVHSLGEKYEFGTVSQILARLSEFFPLKFNNRDILDKSSLALDFLKTTVIIYKESDQAHQEFRLSLKWN